MLERLLRIRSTLIFSDSQWTEKQTNKQKRKKKSRGYSCSGKSKVFDSGVASDAEELLFILTGEGADAVLVLEKKISLKQSE